MRLKAACLVLVLVGAIVAAVATTAKAQEGFPMTGTWAGDWGPDKAHRTQVTLVMDWDVKKISGLINPGPDSVKISTATLDTSKWALHLETDAKDPACALSHFVADGKLDNIGSYNRTVTGTYTYGTTKGDFKITRD
jgi:hypothetical protein